MTDRASIFDNSLDFDVSGFTPKTTKAAENAVPAEAVRIISEASHFPSREAVKKTEKPVEKKEQKELRRYRTGRNVQLNIKVKSETLAAFYDIADKKGWVLGETLERALQALQKQFGAKNEGIGES